MSKCAILGLKPISGRSYTHRGEPKAKGGFGLKVTGKNKRWFRPNLQRVKLIEPNGQIHYQWVSVKAIRCGLVTKAPKQKIARQISAELAAVKKK